MNQFILKYQGRTSGMLSAFDCLVRRGTIRALAMNAGMISLLSRMGVLVRDFHSRGQSLNRESRRLPAKIRRITNPYSSVDSMAGRPPCWGEEWPFTPARGER